MNNLSLLCWWFFLGLAGLLLQPSKCQQCNEVCSSSSDCVQGTFADCSVSCDNTGNTDTLAVCLAASFDGSTATCTSGACPNAEFASATATCDSTSCTGAKFNSTTVSCSGGSCDDSEFYASSITCSSFSDCDDALFYFSCCDGSGCFNGASSCRSNIVEFCSNVFFNITYKDWGNPICESIATTTTSSVRPVTYCRDVQCQNTRFNDASVWCDSKDSATDVCQSSSFDNSHVFCEAGACQSASFVDTDVTCSQVRTSSTCDNGRFNRTMSFCSQDACDNADFYSSAVTCRDFSSCDTSVFYASCCDGSGCNDGLASCSDVVSFCSQTFVGRTAKDWGNPICKDIKVSTVSLRDEVAICQNGDCVGRQFGDASVWCDNKYASGTCESSSFSDGSVVFCEAGACQSSTFVDTEITCAEIRASSTCDNARFNRTSAVCTLDTCDNSDFLMSAVTCRDFSSCDTSVFYASCCDGSGCNDGLASCSDVVSFCSQTFVGRTAKDWGNPICKDITVSTVSFRDEVAICQNGDCVGRQFGDASVWCDNKYASETCKSSSFSDGSLVFCEAGACQDSTFVDTEITCAEIRASSTCDNSRFTRTTAVCTLDTCDNSDFLMSAVTCRDFSSCDTATFDECSCCDGDGCPSSTVSCVASASFCVNCAGNPICNSLATTSPNQLPLATNAPATFPATITPVRVPTPVPVSVTMTAPVSPKLSLPTNSPTTFSGGSETKNLDVQVNMGVKINAPQGTQSVNVIIFPLNGSLGVSPDNSVTYMPNPDFVGGDAFTLEYCNDSSCFNSLVLVEVIASSSSASPSGLYGLVALAIIPVIAIGFFVWKRQKANNRKDSSELPTFADSAGEASAASTARAPLEYKDQVRTHINERQEEEAKQEDRLVAAQVKSPEEETNQDDAPLVAGQVKAPVHLPDLKDQCRSAVNRNQEDEVPLAHAVQIPSKSQGIDP